MGVIIIDVAAALVFREGTLPITQRYTDSHPGGLWEFPAGKREPGESFEHCLVRELKEELGIEVEVGALLESLTHAYPEKTVHLKFFHCRWLRNEPKPLGCEAVRRVSPTELAFYAFPAADTQLLALLRNSPGLWATK